MTEEKKELQIITLDQIREKALGTPVEIPDWVPDSTITVRLKTIDVTPLLMESGAFPDELSSEVVTMFENAEKEIEKGKKFPADDVMKAIDKGRGDGKTSIKMERIVPVLDKLAKEALVEPTFEQIQEVYPLTLQQKMAIFRFVTGGIESMKPFRKK